MARAMALKGIAKLQVAEEQLLELAWAAADAQRLSQQVCLIHRQIAVELERPKLGHRVRQPLQWQVVAARGFHVQLEALHVAPTAARIHASAECYLCFVVHLHAICASKGRHRMVALKNRPHKICHVGPPPPMGECNRWRHPPINVP